MDDEFGYFDHEVQSTFRRSLTPPMVPTNTRTKISSTPLARIGDMSKKKRKKKQKSDRTNEKGIQKKAKSKVRPMQRLSISCPICFEELRTGKVSVTMCGHIFCTTCISKSMQSNRRLCPTCRRKLLPNAGFHPLYLNMEEIKESKAE